MGVAQCAVEDLATIGKDQIVRYRKNQFGCEVLNRNKAALADAHPGRIVDPVTTKLIMLFYTRGEEF